jgi:hypothetical protein
MIAGWCAQLSDIRPESANLAGQRCIGAYGQVIERFTRPSVTFAAARLLRALFFHVYGGNISHYFLSGFLLTLRDRDVHRKIVAPGTGWS